MINRYQKHLIFALFFILCGVLGITGSLADEQILEGNLLRDIFFAGILPIFLISIHRYTIITLYGLAAIIGGFLILYANLEFINYRGFGVIDSVSTGILILGGSYVIIAWWYFKENQNK